MPQPMEFDWIDLLFAMKAEIEDATKDLLLPTRVQEKGEEEGERVPEVHLMRLPDSKAAKKKAPYVLIQLITTADVQEQRQQDDSYVILRFILCTYNHNEEEGALALLNLATRIRIRLLKKCAFGGNAAFVLDKTEKLEFMAYPDDTAPYYAGEMIGLFHIPPIIREVNYG